MAEVNRHYDADYFRMTKDSSAYASVIDRFKFEADIRPGDNVVDFGCGGGYMLSALPAAGKVGVEVNETSAREARGRGLKVVSSLAEVENHWADVIISHHALEHVDDPLGIVRAMFAKLKHGGRVILVTPDESFKMAFRQDDTNFHLFTWSPSNLGNLLKRAGFVRIAAAPVHHRWPPYWWHLGPLLGPRLMHVACVLYGRLRTDISQVKAVGYKP